MLRDYLRMSMRSLRRRSLRSWLTILGIVVGVAAVVALIAIGEGMQQSVEQQFETIGYSTIILREPTSADLMSQMMPPSDASGMTQGAVTPPGMNSRVAGSAYSGGSAIAVLDELVALPSVAVAGAQREETAMVISENLAGIGILRLIGMTPSMPIDFPLYFEGYAVEQGRAFTDEDLFVVVLGPSVAADLGVVVGDQITIQGTPFDVLGILAEPEPIAGGFTVGETSFSLFVPIPALESLFGRLGSFSMAFVEATEGASIDGVVAQVRDEFTEAGIPMSATTASELSAEIGAAVSSVNLTLSAIAGIALLVGVLGVMNTMYTSVLERTREIGILKAVGAKDRDVLGLFLFESGLLGLLGGALGILLGIGLSGLAGSLISDSLSFGVVNQTVESTGMQTTTSAGMAPAFSAWLILSALGLSLLLGTLAGVLPAWRGAKLPPVRALRYE